MTTYKTNNNLGSSALKDLADNAENLDHFVNDSDNSNWDDRLGRTRLTLKGLEEAAVSAGPTVEAAIRANEQANEAKKNSDEIIASTSAYIEGAKTSADDAKSSALDSTNAAARSESAAGRAESVVDVGGTYPTVSAGLAATSPGGYFRIPQGVADLQSFIYYRNVAGAAVLATSQPSTTAMNRSVELSIEAVTALPESGFHSSKADIVTEEGEAFHFTIMDRIGKVALGVTKDEKLKSGLDLAFQGASDVIGSRSRKLGFINDEKVVMGIDNGKPFIGNNEILDNPNSVYRVEDSTGQPLIDFAYNAGVSLGGIEITETNLVDGFVIMDREGRILLQSDINGSISFEGKDNISPKKFVPVIAEINHVQINSQSLGLGVGSPAVSVTPSIYDCLMPDLGVADGPVVNGDLSGPPIKSTGFAKMNGNIATNKREFPTYGMCNQLKYMMPGDFAVLGSNCGHGGYAAHQLDKEGLNGVPTPNYLLGVQQAEAYADYAARENKSLLTQFLVDIQGETDISIGTTKAEFKRRKNNLITDFNNDLSQEYTCCMVTYQTGSHTIRSPGHAPDIPIGQWELQKENPLIFLACATYVFPYNNDGVHMPANSYRWMGCYIGKALASLLSGNGWRPLEPERVLRNRNVIVVDFHVPKPPMVIDTTRVSNPGDYGLEVWDGDVRLTISAISLLGESKVKIITNEIPTNSVTVKYGIGITGQKAGPITGARGNLRDSDDTAGYENNTLTGLPYELFNWCPIFELKEGEE